MSTILSLDIGTSKLCALGYCTEKKSLVGCEVMANDASVDGLPHGFHEQSPKRIMEVSLSAIRALLDSGYHRCRERQRHCGHGADARCSACRC